MDTFKSTGLRNLWLIMKAQIHIKLAVELSALSYVDSVSISCLL